MLFLIEENKYLKTDHTTKASHLTFGNVMFRVTWQARIVDTCNLRTREYIQLKQQKQIITLICTCIKEENFSPSDVPLKTGPSAVQCYSGIAHEDAVSSFLEGSGRKHSKITTQYSIKNTTTTTKPFSPKQVGVGTIQY
jgi:hypothetical protein